MKNFKLVLVATAVTFFSFTSKAQNQNDDTPVKRPRWYSEKGYWVVESTLQSPENATVYFYTNANQLIYSEKVTGTVLNTRKHRVLVKLKRATEKVMGEWESKPVTLAQGQLRLFVDKKNNS